MAQMLNLELSFETQSFFKKKYFVEVNEGRKIKKLIKLLEKEKKSL